MLFLSVLFPLAATPQEPQPSSPGSATKRWISVTRVGDVSAASLAVIGSIADRQPYTVKPGDTPADVLRHVYGRSTSSIVKYVASVEPKILQPLQPGDTLQLPPSLDWRNVVPSHVPTGESYLAVAGKVMGTQGNTTRTAIEELNNWSAGQLEQPVAPNTTFFLPYAHTPVTFAVNVSSADVAALLTRLNADDGLSGAKEVPPPPHLTPSYTHLASASSRCPYDLPAGWQFNGWLSCCPASTIRADAVVAAIDSGIAYRDPRLLPNLWQDSAALAYNPNTVLAKELAYTVNGKAFVPGYRGYPEDDCLATNIVSHGTHIAGLLAGWGLPPETRRWLGGIVHIMVAKVANSKGDIDEGRLASAIQYAADKSARVANLSLQLDGDSDTISDKLKSVHASLLCVVAAGNGDGMVAQDIDAAPVYPAAYSLTMPNVMSVAAVDNAHAPVCFSNYGANTVDIAAPGVSIESTKTGVGLEVMDGTSQATALVSLAAALVQAQAPTLEPQAVRRRLMATADWYASLAKKVRSGELNVCKALVRGRDVVQLTDMTWRAVTITSPTQVTIDGQTVPLSSLETVIVDATPGMDSVGVIDPVNQSIMYRSYPALISSVTIKDTAGVEAVYTRTQLRQLTPWR